MKILVYGAGVLGSVYAARLYEAGHDVTILARGERLRAIQAQGIRLEEAQTGRRSTTLVPAIGHLEPDEPYSLVLVLVRKNQLSEVLPILAANRHTPNVLFMTNNAAGPDELARALGRERVLLGFPGGGGTRVGQVVRYRLAGRRTQPTTLGELDGQRSPRLRQIAHAFEQAGLPVAICNNMDAWLKTHVALVSPIANALYLAGGDNYRLARTRDGLVLLVRATREGLRVLEAAGIPITPPWYRVLTILPEPFLVALLRWRLATESASLMLAGHARAARDEMQQLADEFRVLARRTTVPTPALERLYAYLDPLAPPLPDGSARLALDWGAVLAGAGALGGVLAVRKLAGSERPPWWVSALGGASGGWLGGWLGTPHAEPMLAAWYPGLVQVHGEAAAVRLLAQVQARYEELCARAESPDHPALRLHLEHNILPGLALYQVLQAWHGDRSAALAEVERIFHTRRPLHRTLRLLGYLPHPFAWFRWLTPSTMRAFPPQGWRIEWVENSPQRVAFDIHRCFYLDTLSAYGATELTALFCGMDDVLYEALPPQIRWERTTTLARGGTRCDFCWSRATAHERPDQTEHQKGGPR